MSVLNQTRLEIMKIHMHDDRKAAELELLAHTRVRASLEAHNWMSALTQDPFWHNIL